MQEEAAGHAGEARGVGCAGEEAAVDVGELVGGGRDFGGGAVGELRVHRAEDLADHFVGVLAVAFGHLLDGAGEEVVAEEDAGGFGEEAEDEARHKVVHIVAAGVGGPVGVVFEELDVELVEAAGGADVDGVVFDFLDGGDAGEGEEEGEVVGEVGVIGGNGFAGREVFGFEGDAVGGEDEFGFGGGGFGALAEGEEGVGDLAGLGDGYVDFFVLEDGVREVGRVGVAFAEALEGEFFIVEGG